MSKATPLVTSVAALAFSLQANAQELPAMENDGYAAAVANHLTANCPTTAQEAVDEQKIALCVDTTRDTAYSIAVDLSTFIKETTPATVEALFAAGTAQGDLLANCETPMKNLSEKEFSTLQNHFTATMYAVTLCVDSIRRADDAVGVTFEPLAVNTVANQVNCLRGRPECVTTVSGGAPVFISN